MLTIVVFHEIERYIMIIAFAGHSFVNSKEKVKEKIKEQLRNKSRGFFRVTTAFVILFCVFYVICTRITSFRYTCSLAL